MVQTDSPTRTQRRPFWLSRRLIAIACLQEAIFSGIDTWTLPQKEEGGVSYTLIYDKTSLSGRLDQNGLVYAVGAIWRPSLRYALW